MEINITFIKKINELRSSLGLDSDVMLDVLSLVAFLAKTRPEKFSRIVDMGDVGDGIKAIINELEHQYPYSVLNINIQKVTPRALQQLVYLVTEFSDFEVLAQSILAAYEQSNRYSGQFMANQNSSKLFLAITGHCEDKTVFDGACGLARIAGTLKSKKLLLQELNQSTYAIAYRLLSLLNQDFELINENSLTSSTVTPCDIVVMQPPIGMKLTTDIQQKLEDTSFLFGDKFKSVPTSAGDALWIQLALANLNSTGKAYLHLPRGLLFRGGYDASIREYLIDNELIETIIALPAGMLDFSAMPTMMLVLNKNKTKGEGIRFVDVSTLGSKNRNGIVFSDDDIEQISALVTATDKEDPRIKQVTIREIRQQENNLRFERYFEQDNHVELPDLEEEKEKLSQTLMRYEATQKHLHRLLGM